MVVPDSPIETGAAATHGPLDVWEATKEAAQERLEHTVATLRSENLDADGALGDFRPLRALANAVDSSTRIRSSSRRCPPKGRSGIASTWSTGARSDYPDIPVTHIVATPIAPAELAL